MDDQGDFANRLADPFELFVELLAGMRTEFMSILVQKYSQVHKYNEEDFRIDWFFTIPPFINNDPGLPGRLVTEFLPRAGFTEPTTLSINHIFEPEAAAIRVLSQSLLAPRLSPLSQGFPKLQVNTHKIKLLAIEDIANLKSITDRREIKFLFVMGGGGQRCANCRALAATY